MDGNMSVRVRLSEHEFYDAFKDAMVTRVMAITNTGSYWTDIESSSFASMRVKKAAFKDETVKLIQAGVPPRQVILG
jgi:hypothetical protein